MPVFRALPDFRKLLILLPALTPLLPIHFASWILFAWSVLSLVFFIKFPLQRIAFPRLILLPVLMLALFLVALAFADDVSNQLKYIERNLAWLLIPLSFWLMGFRERNEWMKMIFYFSIAYTAMMLNAHIITAISLFNSKVDSGSLTYLYRTSFENISGLHPAYATLFSGFCILYCTYLLLSQITIKKGNAVLLLLISMAHFVSTVLLASRMALAATIISMMIMMLMYRAYWHRGIVMLTTIIITGFIFMKATPFISSRMNEVSKEALQMPTKSTANTLSIRKGIYTCGIDLLQKYWLFGLTPGDLQARLNDCYGKINASDLQQQEYNTHNEYLNKWLSFGIAGIILLLSIMILPFIKALKKHFILFACFIILMSVVLISENMFSRQYGLFFFLIFYSSGITLLNSESTIDIIENKS